MDGVAAERAGAAVSGCPERCTDRVGQPGTLCIGTSVPERPGSQTKRSYLSIGVASYSLSSGANYKHAPGTYLVVNAVTAKCDSAAVGGRLVRHADSVGQLSISTSVPENQGSHNQE